MKNKIRLLALIYSPEDQIAMKEWQGLYSSIFEIVEWSNQLVVPIQSAVAHFCTYENIDGLLIDDYGAYDPIVIGRITDLLPASMMLFSAQHGDSPLIGEVPINANSQEGNSNVANDNKNVFVFTSSEPSTASKVKVAV